ncbi:MAG: aldehyde dehydrogenase family protein [Candidatus Pelagibacter sp. TMED64]|nr:aldehyde dehydrogenase family protein [Candidatus Pelagibacter sp.]OUU67604.1 MAG: aldehyde dehydrogenase family protein [Candidatus Pelagibacter sp. TMED64]|tara:strand:+ start:1 stop:1440 length:1440 start_codon:yes stop_codon:yes gene_type:complete
MIDKKKFYINGKWINPIKPNEIKVIDPATEKDCAVISLGGLDDVNLAVSSAKKALENWAFTSKDEKVKLLESLYELYKKRWADIAEAITLEMGAPKDFSTQLQAGTGASHIKSFIKYLKEFKFEKILGDHAKNQKIIYEPKGVCALITPWNWPMNQVCLKVIPALASGCTMILKPSELAPLSSMILAEIIDEAKFPNGVFNLINGDGAVTGDALTSHPDVNMISFTGSTRAGALISQNAAKDFKRISLELGGKGANIIFKDADPEAVERGALRCFRNSGQSCNAPTRMLVEKSIYHEAVERVKKFANDLKVDDPKKEGDHIGPVISETQYDKIQTLIQKGIDEGAKLVAGGIGKPSGIEKGYFVKPTAFANVNNQMQIARTEIFGPVLSIIPFETEEEAIKIANDTPYGLTNYIQTQDQDKANRVARKLRSGMVDVNGAGIAVDAPFGGFKHSGIGREAGAKGLEEFLEVKSVGGWNEN